MYRITLVFAETPTFTAELVCWETVSVGAHWSYWQPIACRLPGLAHESRVHGSPASALAERLGGYRTSRTPPCTVERERIWADCSCVCISPPTVVSFAASAIFRTGASRRLRGGSPEPPPSAQTSSIASDPRKRPMPKANAAAASPITIRLERSESRDFSPQAACSRTMCSTSTRHIPSFTLVRAGIGVAIVPESARASRFEEVGYGLIMRMQKRSRVERGTDRSGRREHAPFRVSRGVLRLTSCRIERGHVERRRDEGAFANSRQPII